MAQRLGIAPSAAEYVCHVDSFFTFDSDTTPSADAQKFLGSVQVIAFNEAYENVDGITMDGDDIEDVSYNNTVPYLISLCPVLSSPIVVVVVVVYALISILSLT